MVFSSPAASGTFGSHFSHDFARVMSGRRGLGSSLGSGLWMTRPFLPVARGYSPRYTCPVRFVPGK